MSQTDKNLEALRLDALKRYRVLDTDPEAGYDEVTAIAASICETPIALVSLIDENRQWFKSRVGLDAKETPREIAFCHHAIQRPELFEVEDARRDPRFQDNPLVTGPPDIRYYAGAPLVAPDGYRLGTLCVIDRRPRRLTDLQKNALEALARQVVSQLELRRALHEAEIVRRQLEDEVEQRIKLEAMYRRAERFLLAIGDALLDHIAIVDPSGEIIQVNQAWVDFARDNSPKPVLPQLGPGANYLQVCERAVAAGSKDAAAVIEAIRLALDGKLAHGFSLEYPCHGNGKKRWYIVRISGFTEGGQHYAVVSHQNVTERRLAEEQLRLLNQDLEARVDDRTRQLSQANELLRTSEQQQRALAARLRQIREEERRQISREIHDELGQMLTALKIDLTVLRRDLDEDSQDLTRKRLRADLNGMTELVDNTLGSLRRIARRMRPEVLDTLGLVSALHAQAADFRSWTGAECIVEAPDGLPTLDDAARTALFRIVQESLTNIARHAKAERVVIRISLTDQNDLTIAVEDDGIGFVESGSSLPSLGLLGMRERATDVGAKLTVESQPGIGTTVAATLRLSERCNDVAAED